MAEKLSLKDKVRKGFPEGFPFPVDLEMLCDWVGQNGLPISGYFRIFVDEERDAVSYWMGFDDVSRYLGVFGSAPDGSMYALWRDEVNNTYKVVHMGSEGGELFILAHNFVDFLRLLAIGYDEIGFCDLSKTPQENEGYDEDTMNPRFAEWVTATFNVTIPKTGNEIVNIYDKSFDNWVQDQLSEYS
jgi:hypothetical protein